jgi:hypothetical protein
VASRAQTRRDRRDGPRPLVLDRRERQAADPPDGEPLLADIPEQAPRPGRERLAVEDRERLRRAEPRALPADEQDPAQEVTRQGSL